MKRIFGILVLFFCLGFLTFLTSSKTEATCSFPKKYDCNNIINAGPNLATNIHEDNLKAIRDQMGGSNAVIKITVALTDQVIADKTKVDSYLKLLVDNGFLPTIRIYGVPAAKDAEAIGTNLSNALKTSGLTDAIIEFANEPNLEYSGGTVQQKANNFAQAFINFANKCAGCEVYLPALGGTSAINKQDFANTVMTILKGNSALDKISGIAFNSYADTGLGAITDWLKTLDNWKKAASDAGVNLNFNGLSYFLTEVGPAGAGFDTPHLETFAQSIVDAFNKLKDPANDEFCQKTLGDMCDSFKQLAGFSFFIWNSATGDLYSIVVDANGMAHLIKTKQKAVSMPSTTDPSRNDDGQDTPVTGFAHPPTETIEICPGDDGSAPPATKTAPIANVTTTPPVQPGVLIPTSQLLQNANLRFGQPVKVRSPYVSKLCAQKQGEPIILEEAAYYSILDKGCIERPWKGELTVSGMKIPFAQAIADHWAGTMDTEHLTPKKYDQLMSDAQLLGTTGEKARNEINLRTGAIKKLLPQESLDRLKCDFVNYVAKRSASGKSTQYKNYVPAGKPLTGEAIKLTQFAQKPPGCRNDNECTKMDASTPEEAQAKTECMKKWDEKWGDAWSKMPVLPNEEAKGQLKFMVCGNNQYILNTAVPEVFRLGLAANILQQSMTSKETMDKFYDLYPEFKANEEGADGSTFTNNLNNFVDSSGQNPKNSTIWQKLASNSLQEMNKVPILHNLMQKISDFIPRIQKTFAQAKEIYKNPSKLLAQVTVPQLPADTYSAGRTISCELNPDRSSINVTVTLHQKVTDGNGVSGTSFADISADVWQHTNGQWKKMEVQGQSSDSVSPKDGSSKTFTYPVVSGVSEYKFGTYLVPAPGVFQNDAMCDFNRINPEDGFCSIDLAKNKTQDTNLLMINFVKKGECFLTNNGDTSAPGGSCSNGSCDFNIKITPAPPQPDTQVLLWNTGSYKPQGKFTIGAKFKIQNNPSEESVAKCLKDPATCDRLATNERPIGVYNNVPMLVTAWIQSAGKIKLDQTTTLFGFLSNIKPWGTKGTNSISAFDLGNFCTSNQDEVLDKNGEFKKIDAVSSVTYRFRQTSGNPGYNYTPPDTNITDRGDQCGTVDDCPENEGMTLGGCTGAPRKCRYKDANGNQVTLDQVSSDDSETPDYIEPNVITDRGDQCGIPDDCPENDGLTLTGCTGAPRKCRYKDAGGNPITLGETSNNISPDGVRVTMASPSKRNLLWYRLKGLCNANKWWSEKVLNPLTKTLGSALVGYTPPETEPAGCYKCDTPLNNFNDKSSKSDPNMCKWSSAADRPPLDNGKCIHFLGDYTKEDLPGWIKKMKDMGMTWSLVPFHDENQLRYAAKAFKEAGITPVWRFMRASENGAVGGAIQPWRNEDWAGEVKILTDAGLPPYIQIFNEPSDDREWNNKNVLGTDVFADYWVSNAIRIYNAGGYPGLQVTDTEELQAVIDKVKEYGKEKLFSRMFFVPHAYGGTLSPDQVDGDTGVMSFTQFADVFADKVNGIGFIPPFIVGEGGWDRKTGPGDTSKVDKDTQAEYYRQLYQKFPDGKMAKDYPYLLAFCAWTLYEKDYGRGWFESSMFKGEDLKETIDAVTSVTGVRPNMCRK